MKKRGYICKTGFIYDLGMTATEIYASLDELKRANSCWEQCGVYLVEIRVIHSIHEGTQEDALCKSATLCSGHTKSARSRKPAKKSRASSKPASRRESSSPRLAVREKLSSRRR